MSGHTPDARLELRERLVESAADRALFGGSSTIDDVETARELDLDLEAEQLVFEQIVAELAAQSALSDRAPMPVHVEARLRNLCTAMHAPRAAGEAATKSDPAPLKFSTEPRGTRLDWLAAAACVAIGAAGTALVLRAGNDTDERSSRRAADLDSYLATHPGTMRVRWTGTEDDHVIGPVGGEVCFDATTNDGILVIEGLAPNDPAREQYQLWIFDATRDERFPVDGGVFDVPKDGRAIIPVVARLPVSKPVLFAVTVEKPGGVVVSDRRIALVAKP
ncbi:MAG: anti-sigma factor [Planctomycetaceae bacterium]|nr:anti-sigma factor [Planctomycetaceae bacterium]